MVKSTYICGIIWFVLSLAVSNLNDIITKYSAMELPFVQVAFLRFALGMLTLLPFMLWRGRAAFVTYHPWVHFWRGVILFCALTIWCLGLTVVPLVSATLLTFTIPLFVLVLARLFLHEVVGYRLWGATLVGFIGVIILLSPTQASFNHAAWLMVLAAFLFASLDIINKKFIMRESMFSMLFYSALVTTMLGAYPAYIYWQQPTWQELFLLLLLGGNSNFLLFCLLKAFKLVSASSVAPYRYLEIMLSAMLGMLIFGEVLSWNIIAGAVIIIGATMFIAYDQLRRVSSSNKFQHNCVG
jgi:S-adenosylmethionine uptake transporter